MFPPKSLASVVLRKISREDAKITKIETDLKKQMQGERCTLKTVYSETAQQLTTLLFKQA